jgi:hypothetical protein
MAPAMLAAITQALAALDAAAVALSNEHTHPEALACAVAATDLRECLPLDVDLDYDGSPLPSCICGRHYACPDGWHHQADWPCSCTPDCALEDEPEANTGEHAIAAVHDLDHDPDPEAECPECGETFPADDGTLDPTSQLEVCVPCADRLGLLEAPPPPSGRIRAPRPA